MQAQNQKKKKEPSVGSLIGLAISLWLLHPVLLFLFLFGCSVYFLIRQIKKAAPPVRRQRNFDDCLTGLFCFHRDKGEHHVRHGREIDPWDRPDIDISKYRRNR